VDAPRVITVTETEVESLFKTTRSGNLENAGRYILAFLQEEPDQADFSEITKEVVRRAATPAEGNPADGPRPPEDLILLYRPGARPDFNFKDLMEGFGWKEEHVQTRMVCIACGDQQLLMGELITTGISHAEEKLPAPSIFFVRDKAPEVVWGMGAALLRTLIKGYRGGDPDHMEDWLEKYYGTIQAGLVIVGDEDLALHVAVQFKPLDPEFYRSYMVSLSNATMGLFVGVVDTRWG
jgi:hypothetical protein